MRTLLTIFALIIISSISTKGQSEYVHPDFKKAAKSHQKIAVLPWKFKTTLREEDALKLTQEQIHEMQLEDGLAFQQSVYDFFIKKTLKVEVQGVIETNRILLENGITGENIGDYKHKDLASMLDVDALVSGNFKTSQPMSANAAKVIAVITLGGSINGSKGNEATGVMRITDRQGNQMWRYSINKSAYNAQKMINSIMKKSARNIPYM